MGGCATKPKVLKDEFDEAKAPEPIPEVVVKEETSIIKEGEEESKEISEVNNNDGEGVVDEKEIKSRSLSSLLTESAGVKESEEKVTIPSEPAKEAEVKVEVAKAEIQTEVKAEVAKAEIPTESSNTNETKTATIETEKKAEISEEKKPTETKVEEPAKDANVSEKKDSAPIVVEEKKPETAEEKKPIETIVEPEKKESVEVIKKEDTVKK